MYSDGGLCDNEGSAAYAIFLVHTATNDIELARVEAIFLESQQSVFAMEAMAADRAIECVCELFPNSLFSAMRVKRTRFH